MENLTSSFALCHNHYQYQTFHLHVTLTAECNNCKSCALSLWVIKGHSWKSVTAAKSRQCTWRESGYTLITTTTWYLKLERTFVYFSCVVILLFSPKQYFFICVFFQSNCKSSQQFLFDCWVSRRLIELKVVSPQLSPLCAYVLLFEQ